ncbi:MAG: hypothetical protein MI923_09430 [Phycisphaerales bacterium]|nr:hypothetical protein [Phycisphaerales bacterium]
MNGTRPCRLDRHDGRGVMHTDGDGSLPDNLRRRPSRKRDEADHCRRL